MSLVTGPYFLKNEVGVVKISQSQEPPSFPRRIRNVLKALFTSDYSGPYHYVVLAKIGTLHNVQKLAEILKEQYTLVKTIVPRREQTAAISDLQGTSPELVFKADTLHAAITPTKATLYQKTVAPFTLHDVALREIILEWYPNQYTMFFFAKEPEFTIQTTPTDPPQEAVSQDQP